MFDHYKRAWTVPVMTTDHHPRSSDSPGADLVDVGALHTLGALSDHFALTDDEGVIPSEDDLARVRDGVSDMMRDVRESTGLPENFRQAMMDRLHDILWALDRLDIGGPGAVQEAIKRLIGEAVFYAAQQPASKSWSAGLWERVKPWVTAFHALPQTRDAVGAAADITKMLGM